MSIPGKTIDLIRESAQIEEIVQRYVPSLKKRGGNYIGLCPFHKEKTPSFTVSPEKQIFYCFGCHIGGSVFSFISKIEGMNFPESVHFVGNIIGIKVEEESKGRMSEHYEKLKEINRITMDLYHKTIRTGLGKEGLNYLLGRGVLDNSIQEFKLGCSPDSWDYLTNHMRELNISLDLAHKIGLLGVSERGEGNKNYYDKLRNRIIFPIIDHRNDIIAFGGRLIGEGEPKYINSPESILFKKRRVLYGFNIAKKYISDLERAIVVEGYLDVIGCHQAGIKNVIAPLGTALTIDQARLLARFCKEIVLLFDSDSAGINASLRSIEIFRDISVDVKVAVLPEGDPFEFIVKSGIRKFMAIVDQALTPIDFRIKRAIAHHNLGSNERFNVLMDVFNIIKELEYETEKDIYLKRISFLLGVEENSVRADFKRYLQKGNISETKKLNKNSDRGKIGFLTRCYREIILLLCHYPELIEQAIIDFPESDFSDVVSRNIFKKLTEIFSLNEKVSIGKMLDFFTDGEERKFLEENLFKACDIEDPTKDYTERFIRLKLCHIDQEIDRYADLINEASNSQRVDLEEFFVEYEILRREREKLSSYFL